MAVVIGMEQNLGKIFDCVAGAYGTGFWHVIDVILIMM